LFTNGFAFAQNKTGILGTVLDAKTQRPLAYVVVSIQNECHAADRHRWKIQF
jgi:hypothetical protein